MGLGTLKFHSEGHLQLLGAPHTLPNPTPSYPITNPLLSHFPSLPRVGHTHISF